MVSENLAMRYRRLAFYSDDVERFNGALHGFVQKSGAACALLIDKEGHMVAKQGHVKGLDTTALSALVAGSFASTREVAKLLGEQEFTVLSHQGKAHSIFLILVGERTLQVTVFPSSAKLGLIQVMSSELAQKIGGMLSEIAARPETETKKESLSGDYSGSIGQKLDELFGDL